MTAASLVDRYFDAWATTDPARRHELVGTTFAENATRHAAPANVSFLGRGGRDRSEHRPRERRDLVRADFSFTRGEHRENYDSIQLEWTVNTPDGTAVAWGHDCLLLNAEGQIAKLYMFNG